MICMRLFSSIVALIFLSVATTPSLAANKTRASDDVTISGVLAGLTSGKLKVVDLSHVLNSATPDFFGEKDIYHFDHAISAREDGYSTGCFQTPEHYGTHIDAPVHFARGAEPVDKIPVARLVLPAVAIDVRDQVNKNPDFELSVAAIRDWENQHKQIPPNAIVLLLTGWSKYWGCEQKYRNADSSEQMHFPGYSAEAARFLVEERKVVAIGIDTLSIDPGNSKTFPVHKIVGSHNVYGIENLHNLDQLPATDILLFSGPLAIEGGSGCPARVIAVINN